MTCPLCNDTGIVITHNAMTGRGGDVSVCLRCYRLIPEAERAPVELRAPEPTVTMTFEDWTRKI